MNVVKNFERHGERNRMHICEDAVDETVKCKAVVVNIADSTPPIVVILVIERHADGADRIARLNHREQRAINAAKARDIQQQKRAACISALIARRSNVAAFADQLLSLDPLACAARRRQRIVALDESRS